MAHLPPGRGTPFKDVWDMSVKTATPYLTVFAVISLWVAGYWSSMSQQLAITPSTRLPGTITMAFGHLSWGHLIGNSIILLVYAPRPLKIFGKWALVVVLASQISASLFSSTLTSLPVMGGSLIAMSFVGMWLTLRDRPPILTAGALLLVAVDMLRLALTEIEMVSASGHLLAFLVGFLGGKILAKWRGQPPWEVANKKDENKKNM